MASRFVFSWPVRNVEDMQGLVMMPAMILMSQNDPYGCHGAKCDTLIRGLHVAVSNTNVILEVFNILGEGFLGSNFNDN